MTMLCILFLAIVPIPTLLSASTRGDSKTLAALRGTRQANTEHPARKLQPLSKDIVMKKNQLARLIATIAFGTACTAAFAADKPSGTVRFEGSIVEAPCSIASDSINQTVPMDQIASAEIKGGKKSTPKTFNIDLLGCDLEDVKKSVTATFTTATPSDAYEGLIAIQGVAKGASLGIADGRGQLIKMGDESSATKISTASPSMQFQAFLQGEQEDDGQGKKDVAIVPGEFNASVNFMLTYK